MADVKAIPMQKRIAMGENVTGMKKGGAVRTVGTTKSSPPFKMKVKGKAKGGKC